MRPSSDSIAQLASALAKAQIELVNPTKTLTGVIDRWGRGHEGQSYRYAPLSAGLEIVRKALCKHELAVIQTTHVDRDSAMVLLTTTLAHGSGEWICATWPVCCTSEMSNPKMMGAALTYARRYGLFTLVGIAGEDDLDAPDLPGADPGQGTFATDPVPPTAKPNGDSRPQETSPEVCDQGLGGTHFDEPVNFKAAPSLADQQIAPLEFQAAVDADSSAKVESASVPFSGFSRSTSFSHDGGPYPKRRGRAAPRGMPRHRLLFGLSGDPVRDLLEVQDQDGLFRWALAVLPLRNKLPDATREALDAAFLAKADALRSDPDEVVVRVTGPPLQPSTEEGSFHL